MSGNAWFVFWRWEGCFGFSGFSQGEILTCWCGGEVGFWGGSWLNVKSAPYPKSFNQYMWYLNFFIPRCNNKFTSRIAVMKNFDLSNQLAQGLQTLQGKYPALKLIRARCARLLWQNL